MNEIRFLTVLELRNLYSINKIRYTKDRKRKNQYRILTGVWIFLLLMVLGYVGGQVYGLCYLGLNEIVPSYLVAISSVLILVFGFFRAGATVFGSRGYDLLSSMPLKTGSIVISRFLGLYVEDLLLTALIFIPGFTVYGICVRPGMEFYLLILLCGVFVPAIPLVVSLLLGTLILAVSSRVRHKSLMQTALMLILVIAILVGSFTLPSAAENWTADYLASLADMVGKQIQSLYPPAHWISDTLMEGSWTGLVLFLSVSTAMMAVAIGTAAALFHTIIQGLQSHSASHNYRIQRLKSQSLLKALYLRELKRYFSSSIYVTNTIIGPILGCLMSLALLIAGPDSLDSLLPGMAELDTLIPFIYAAVSCLMNTTSVSISMEGRQFWIVKSLPVPVKTLFDSKLLLNLTLLLPSYVLSEVFLILALKPDLMELIPLLLIPLSMMLLSIVLGITVNLKLHSFDWEKEEQVVKQSAAAALGGMTVPLLCAAAGAVAFLLPDSLQLPVNLGICAVFLISALLLYRHNNRTVLSKL